MENTTTGYYMETFIDMLKMLVLSLIVVVNIIMFKRICGIEQEIADINRAMLSSREPLKDTKPIKPNNWDSIRQALKRPARVNERD